MPRQSWYWGPDCRDSHRERIAKLRHRIPPLVFLETGLRQGIDRLFRAIDSESELVDGSRIEGINQGCHGTCRPDLIVNRQLRPAYAGKDETEVAFKSFVIVDQPCVELRL